MHALTWHNLAPMGLPALLSRLFSAPLLLTASLLMAAEAGAAAAAASQMPTVANTLAAGGFRGVIISGNTERVEFARAIGMADLAAGRPLTLADSWPWASVTKQITAILVMQEVEKGRIDLDQPLVRYLPQFQGPGGATITIRQLLKHTSGLPNPDDTPAASGHMPAFYLETGPAIGAMARARGYCGGPSKAASGAGFEYNNCDYLVLEAVLEQVTGASYRDLVRSRLAQPLALSTLRPSDDTVHRPSWPVRGYTDAVTVAPPANFATLGAAGALGGSPSDLFALDQALMKGSW